MSDILSQEEIEALLSSLSSGDAAEGDSGSGASEPSSGGGGGVFIPATRPGSNAPIAYEVYDFRRPDKFSKEQLRTLQMLHETFGRLGATALSAYLRQPVSIELISLEQVPYEEYLRSIKRSVFTVMSLPPLSGEAALEMEVDLVFVMLDRLLGGIGRSIKRDTLTDIEIPLLRQIIDRLLTSLKSSWEGMVVVNPHVESIETASQFVQIAPPSDIVVSVLFEVRMGSVRGAMSLCIPYMVLKPITTRLSAQRWFASGGPRRGANPNRKHLLAMLQESQVECIAELGKGRLTVRDFLSIRQGDILPLTRRTEDEIDLRVSGVRKFLGRPALQGKKLVFHISDTASTD